MTARGWTAGLVLVLLALSLALVAAGGSGTADTAFVAHAGDEIASRSGVPPLPFPDNPDPAQCGIPVQWSGADVAFVTGVWDGELVQPEVLLYDSHLRREIVGRIPHGGRVVIELSQANPVLN
jgi:hypothetical protein